MLESKIVEMQGGGNDISPKNIDWFGIVAPEATRNLIRNPILQRDIAGYVAAVDGCSIERSDSEQYSGSHSLKIQYSLPRRIEYAVTISTVGNYTFSVYVYIQNPRPSSISQLSNRIQIFIEDPASATVVSTYYASRGYWERVILSFVAQSTGTYTIVFYGDNGTVVYVDGLQLENKAYATTLCHGDMVGDAYPRVDYWWLGIPHNSASERSGCCRTGGREVNFFEIGLRTIAIVGLGISGIGNILVPTSKGSVYVNSIIQDRTFTIVADRTFPTVPIGMRERREVEKLMSPFITASHQPMLLTYQHYDVCGNPDGSKVFIKCLYESGLEGALSSHQERIGITFRVYLPYLASSGSFGKELVLEDTTLFETHSEALVSGVALGTDSSSYALSATFSGAGSNYAYDMVYYNGKIYVGGYYGDCNGLPNTRRLSRYNLQTDEWETVPGIDGFMPTVTISNMVVSPDNKLYLMGYNALASFIVIVDEDDNFTTLTPPPGKFSAGFMGRNTVSKSGKLYLVGYTTVGMVNSYFVYELQDDLSWDKVSYDGVDRSGFNNIITGIQVSLDGTIYVTGWFDMDDTGTYTYNGIVKSIDSAPGWEMLGESGFPSSSYPESLYLDDTDSMLYVGGTFTDVDGISGTCGVAAWNGYSWSAMGSGIVGDVHSIIRINDKITIVGQSLGILGGYSASLSYQIIYWDAGWKAYPFSILRTSGDPLGDIPYVRRILSIAGRVFILFAVIEDSYLYSYSMTEVDYDADASSVGIYITGPMYLTLLKNIASEEILLFDLEIFQGEVLTLSTEVMGLTLTSSTRGSLTHEILPGSTGSFTLAAGMNHIFAMCTGTTSDSSITIFSTKVHQSLGGAFIV